MYKRQEFSSEERKKLADKGVALPDGSFPIENVADLKNAIHAYGRAKDQKAAAKHIAKRAKALGHEDLIPDSDDFQKSLKEAKDSDTFTGNPGEDERMVDIRAFRGSVKDLTSFIEDKIKENQVAEGVEIKSAKNKHGEEFKIGDQIVAPDKKSVKITGFMKGKDGHMKAMYNAGMFADVYNLDDVEKI